MPTKRDKLRSAVLEGIRKHEAAKTIQAFKKIRLLHFSVSPQFATTSMNLSLYWTKNKQKKL